MNNIFLKAAVGWKAPDGTWIFKCGSTLISSKFTLTAAHCTRASDRDTTIADVVPKIVRLGDKNIIEEVIKNRVKPTDAYQLILFVHLNANNSYNALIATN